MKKSERAEHSCNSNSEENADVVGDKPVKNDAEEMSMSDDSK